MRMAAAAEGCAGDVVPARLLRRSRSRRRRGADGRRTLLLLRLGRRIRHQRAPGLRLGSGEPTIGVGATVAAHAALRATLVVDDALARIVDLQQRRPDQALLLQLLL